MFICSSYIITKMVKNIEKTPHTLSKFKIFIFCTEEINQIWSSFWKFFMKSSSENGTIF
jgi:hypothetical protein